MRDLVESLLDSKLEHNINIKGMYKDKLEQMLDKSYKKGPYDMFGRELKVGDVCLAHIGPEIHFIQIKEIRVDKNGYVKISSTDDYLYDDVAIAPWACMLIPETYYNNFLKIIK